MTYSSGIRQQLKKLYSNRTDVIINDKHNEFYIQELSRSRYALCPPGWAEWSPRIYDAIHVGSLPVLFETTWLLPFRDIIDYDKIILKCSGQELIECIAKAEGNYTNRHKQVLAVKHLLSYNSGGIGAMDMVVRALSLNSRSKKYKPWSDDKNSRVSLGFSSRAPRFFAR